MSFIPSRIGPPKDNYRYLGKLDIIILRYTLCKLEPHVSGFRTLNSAADNYRRISARNVSTTLLVLLSTVDPFFKSPNTQHWDNREYW
jgi:hypothetical protein